MTTPKSDRVNAPRDESKNPGEATDEVVLLEDLAPRADVLGGRKLVLGEDTPLPPRGPAR